MTLGWGEGVIWGLGEGMTLGRGRNVPVAFPGQDGGRGGNLDLVNVSLCGPLPGPLWNTFSGMDSEAALERRHIQGLHRGPSSMEDGHLPSLGLFFPGGRHWQIPFPSSPWHSSFSSTSLGGTCTKLPGEVKTTVCVPGWTWVLSWGEVWPSHLCVINRSMSALLQGGPVSVWRTGPPFSAWPSPGCSCCAWSGGPTRSGAY